MWRFIDYLSTIIHYLFTDVFFFCKSPHTLIFDKIRAGVSKTGLMDELVDVSPCPLSPAVDIREHLV